MAELTPAQIEAKLRATIHRVEELSEKYRLDAIAEAETEADYRIAFAEHLLRSKEGTVKEREAEAMFKCGQDETMRGRKYAAAVADGTKQALYSERAVLSALQTMARAMQDEMRNAGYGTP